MSMEIPEHFRNRMERRGVSLPEVERVFAEGWPCFDARLDRQCKTFVFDFNSHWDGVWYAEKE